MNFISKLLSDTDCRNKRGNINMEIQTTEKRITNGLRFLEDNNVRFAVVKLISCNGAESNLFADARCGFEVLQDHNKVPSFLPFTVMFEKGVSILRRLENVNTVNNIDGIENLQDPIKEALVCLDKFYKTKGKSCYTCVTVCMVCICFLCETYSPLRSGQAQPTPVHYSKENMWNYDE